ncbi:MAG: hypothetical protein Satyrvirus36_7 [Satyrvirus sp.]|uniref:Uncharacterized protein n=1 Tax=Satyrvirus sp. TaxID=2487771 RepID=A0A3G5AJK1_9VIRU|nr:MAG: hypothetical protein Satyrvirus36_7 [Satyrvirus sp.]
MDKPIDDLPYVLLMESARAFIGSLTKKELISFVMYFSLETFIEKTLEEFNEKDKILFTNCADVFLYSLNKEQLIKLIDFFITKINTKQSLGESINNLSNELSKTQV